MFRTDDLEVWNLTHGGTARTGAVDIFNIVGRLHRPSDVGEFSYSLNDGPLTPVFFNRTSERDGRLTFPGDFNVDTVSLADLSTSNTLRLHIRRHSGGEIVSEIPFVCKEFADRDPRFTLDLEDVTAVEELGQVVEGLWQVGQDGHGRRCLEVTPENAGFDRVITFGRREWTTGYEIFARLAVTKLTSGSHNVGLVFKWNPHAQGDGTWLPRAWSSGLAYYRSYPPFGLRIRYGVKAQRDDSGFVHGDHVLAETPLSFWRRWANRLSRKAGLPRLVTELVVDRDYCFRMQVHPQRHALTCWFGDRKEPRPQLIADKPVEHLAAGAVGIIAAEAGVRLYEFVVRPIQLH